MPEAIDAYRHGPCHMLVQAGYPIRLNSLTIVPARFPCIPTIQSLPCMRVIGGGGWMHAKLLRKPGCAAYIQPCRPPLLSFFEDLNSFLPCPIFLRSPV